MEEWGYSLGEDNCLFGNDDDSVTSHPNHEEGQCDPEASRHLDNMVENFVKGLNVEDEIGSQEVFECSNLGGGVEGGCKNVGEVGVYSSTRGKENVDRSKGSAPIIGDSPTSRGSQGSISICSPANGSGCYTGIKGSDGSLSFSSNGNRALSCPPGATRPMLSGPWSWECLNDLNQRDAEVIFSASKGPRKEDRLGEGLKKNGQEDPKRRKGGGVFWHTVSSLKKVARMPSKERAEVLRVVKKIEHRSRDGVGVVKDGGERHPVSSTVSPSTTSNDWKHWVVMQGNDKVAADDVRTVGEAIGVQITGVSKNMFSVLARKGNQKQVSSGQTQGVGSGEEFYIVNVYAPCDSRAKQVLWDSLSVKIQALGSVRVCVCGDFNAVRCVDERRSTNDGYRHSDHIPFNRFIDDNSLIDLPLCGRKYTWFKGEGRSMSRLDKFLLTGEWCLTWPNCTQVARMRGLSDHCPLVLVADEEDWGPRPLRMLKCWKDVPGYHLFVREKWNSFQIDGWGGFVLKEKFRWIKTALKDWHSSHTQNLPSRIESLKDRLAVFDEKGGEEALSESELAEFRGVSLDIHSLSRLNASICWQQSRSRWLKEGDANTKYFHSVLASRRRGNAISSLQVDGTMVEGVSPIRHAVFSHFASHFKAINVERPRVDNLIFKRLHASEVSGLIKPFSVDEVKAAVWDCDSYKSPGPDGINFGFIKDFWAEMQGDIVRFISEFHRNGRLTKGLNATFIALIPKVDSPQRLNDFRPISLVGSLYKILAKVLANRLRVVMGSVISESQTAFVKGRQILDGILVANEVVDEVRKSKKELLLFKVDFEKAYDSVDWGYLEDVMGRMGFPTLWRKWIKEYVCTTSASILVNGSPTDEFPFERGLRQGDPLSPFLFLLAAEGLHVLMEAMVERNMFTGYSVGELAPVSVSHLQFADDTLLMGTKSWANVRALRAVLVLFESMSGLRVNFHKSMLVGVNIPESWLVEAASALCCKVGKIHFLYLGLPIGGDPRRLCFWEPVLDRLKNRLSGWSSRFLSIGGRLVLIKSVLTSLPVYALSFFKAPSGIISSIESILIKFFWGGSENLRKVSWINWNTICLRKEYGGLGVRQLREFNLALLGKWCWRMLVDREGLWFRVLAGRYGVVRGRLCEGGARGSTWWRVLARIRDGGGEAGRGWFRECVVRQVGDGSDTFFWTDPWVDGISFRERFGRLFDLAENKSASVAEMFSRGWEVGGEAWEWRHRWQWRTDLDDGYTVRGAYQLLTSQDDVTLDAASGLIWHRQVPLKVSICAWRLLRDRLPTKANLVTRGILSTEAHLCVFGCGEVESAQHLFLYCSSLGSLWSLVSSWIGSSSVTAQTLPEHFVQFTDSAGGSRDRSSFMQLVWLVCVWVV
ncbi:unnamed protein product [Trifolium pratense]|uniref:Uncharacterized protein n=1 Tax=Trifolium pratense TaxID=57577 RepID=A0ACB0L3N0_TRIPR|nr:unnamed protein product [Trifolium pratense]